MCEKELETKNKVLAPEIKMELVEHIVEENSEKIIKEKEVGLEL